MAHKTYQYCVAENWGKGFITNDDSRKSSPLAFPGDVWRVPAHNQDAHRWISGVAGVHKTLAEAQAVVDSAVSAAQADWDALPEAEKAPALEHNTRPENITLEE